MTDRPVPDETPQTVTASGDRSVGVGGDLTNILYGEALLIDRELGDRRRRWSWNMSLALDRLDERAQAILHAEPALTIYEQIENPNAAKVRAQLAAWREQTNT